MSNIDKKKKKLAGHIESLEKELAVALSKKKSGTAEKFVDLQRKLDKMRDELRNL